MIGQETVKDPMTHPLTIYYSALTLIFTILSNANHTLRSPYLFLC